MDFKVIWTPHGIKSQLGLVEYIAHHNPAAAERIGEAIFQKALLVEQPPRLVRVFAKLAREDAREFLARPYRLFYRVDEAEHPNSKGTTEPRRNTPRPACGHPRPAADEVCPSSSGPPIFIANWHKTLLFP